MYDDELIDILDENEINYVEKSIGKTLFFDSEFYHLTEEYIYCIFLTDDGLEQLEYLLQEERENAKI
jgi:hypothetical protein